MAKKRWFTVGDVLKDLLDQGHHVSHVDGAILPKNVIDHDVKLKPEKPPLPTSKTLALWHDRDGTRKRR